MISSGHSEERDATYREGANGSSGKFGEVEMLDLDFFTNGERALALELLWGDGSNTLAHSIVGIGLESSALSN